MAKSAPNTTAPNASKQSEKAQAADQVDGSAPDVEEVEDTNESGNEPAGDDARDEAGEEADDAGDAQDAEDSADEAEDQDAGEEEGEADDAGDAEDSAEDGDDDKAEDEEADDAVAFSDDDYAAVMTRVAAPSPKPAKRAKADDDEEDLEDEDDEDADAEEKPAKKGKGRGADADDELDAVLKVIDELDPEDKDLPANKALMLLATKLKKDKDKQAKAARIEKKQAAQRDSQAYDTAIHKVFDSFAAKGKHDIYGTMATGKITQAQRNIRKAVHDLALSISAKMEGQIIDGKPFGPKQAIAAAERTVMEHMGIKPNAKDAKQAAEIKRRHQARKPVSRGSTMGAGAGASDPNDEDGTQPKRRK